MGMVQRREILSALQSRNDLPIAKKADLVEIMRQSSPEGESAGIMSDMFGIQSYSVPR